MEALNRRVEGQLAKLLSAVAAATALSIGAAHGQDTIKIGFIAPSTGQYAQTGNQMIADAVSTR